MSLARRLLLILTLGSFAGILVVSLNPVNSTVFRLALLGSGFVAWAGITILAWKRRPLRIVALPFPALLAIPFFLPGRPIEREELRADYMSRLASYEGTRYFWGGESSLGIDCSGLPRRALRDALWRQGTRHCNGWGFHPRLTTPCHLATTSRPFPRRFAPRKRLARLLDTEESAQLEIRRDR